MEESYNTDKFSVMVKQRSCIPEVIFLSVLFNDCQLSILCSVSDELVNE
jgi:hypothetical protein